VRVLLLADTHSVLDARIAELARECQLALHAGDVGSDDVLDQLASATGRVLAVRGNNDVPGKWRGTPATLAGLPDQLTVPLPGGLLTVEHGHRHGAARRHQRLRATHGDARAVLYGHSHRLLQDRDALPWLLNPGAGGRARTGGGPSCLLLDTGGDWQITELRFPPLSPVRRRRVAGNGEKRPG
jgi:putative phosphoesterase